MFERGGGKNRRLQESSSTNNYRHALCYLRLNTLATNETRDSIQQATTFKMVEHEQAKQLDSVTDVVQEQEVDATKAQQAMSALSSKNEDSAANAADQVAVSKEDVDLIVSELEVTEELAEKTLREVASSMKEGDSLVVAALRKLVSGTV